MGKSTLTLAGAHDAWSRNVRRGQLVRANGTAAPVLVRVVPGVPASPDALRVLREDAPLLARVQHESVLRLEHVSAVAGHVAYVHEACDGASLARIREGLAAVGRVEPTRAAMEIVAAVALALDEALRVADADGRRVHHPGPRPDDVLLEPTGRVRVAGFVVLRPGAAADEDPVTASARLLAWMLRAEAAPEDADGGAARLIQRLERDRRARTAPPTGGSDALRAAIVAALGPDRSARPAVAALGRLLREEAVRTGGDGVRAWASHVVAAAGSDAAVRPPAPLAGSAAVPASIAPSRSAGGAPNAAPLPRADDTGPHPSPAAAAVASLPAVPERRSALPEAHSEVFQRRSPGEPIVPADPPEDRPTRVSGGVRQTIAPPKSAQPPPAQRGLSARTGPALDLLVNGEDDEEEATVIGIARPLDLAPPPPKADLYGLEEIAARPAAAPSPAPVARASSVFDDDAPQAQTSMRAQSRGSGSMGTVIAVVIGVLLLCAAGLAYVLLRSEPAPTAPAAPAATSP